MADPIDVPIKLPTDSASVKAAAAVVRGLEDRIRALGPAAAQGGGAAAAQMAALGAAAQRAKKDFAGAKAAQAVGESLRVKGPLTKEDQAARATAVKAASIAAVKAVDNERKIADKAEKARIRERASAEKKAARELEKATAKAQKETEKNAKGRQQVSGGAAVNKALDTMAALALRVAAAITAIGVATAAAFGVMLVKTQAFKESTTNAFEKLLGSSAKAQAAFKKTIVVAQEIGLSYEDALSGVNSLVAKGFGANQALDLVKAMADLKSVVPDANIKYLLLAISQIKSKGVLQMEELQGQIAEAGLSVSVVLEEIGKKVGKSAAEVRKMISAGKISADQGVQGILAAIQKTTGKPLGDAAKDAANSLQGLLGRVHDLPTALLLVADSSKGMGAVKSALSNVLAAFAPGTKTGDAFAAALGRLGDAFATALSGLTGAGGKDALTTFAGGVTKAVDGVARLISMFGQLVGPSIGAFLKGIGLGLSEGGDGAKGASVDFDKLGQQLAKISEVVGWAIGKFVALTESTMALQNSAGGQALSSMFDQASAALSALGALAGLAEKVFASGSSIGANLVNGIVAGITGGQGLLMSVIQGMTSMVTGGAAKGWQVKSPSRVFRGLGYQLPAGSAQGVQRGTPVLQRAVSRMASTATPNSLGGGGGAMSLNGPGKSLTIGQLGPFYARTEADARAIADIVDARIRSVWAELGAG